MLTDNQQFLIRFLKSVGYGWARFARSVEKQGWCSDAQETTMVNMRSCILFKKESGSRGGGCNVDWDDHNLDAMSEGYGSGDY